MSFSVCVGTANALSYPQGGHLWVFINWSLGFRAAGAQRVIWLDVVDPGESPETVQGRIAVLKSRIAPYGLANALALVTPDGRAVEWDTGCLGPDEATTSAELLFDLRYDLPESVVRRFRRSALLDIDPGLLQIAMQHGRMNPAPHDVYFTIGEARGRLGWPFPTLGLDWIHLPPCISTDDWPVQPAPADGAYTTVSHWYMNEWMLDEYGSSYRNDKRSAFLPFVDLPRRVTVPLELAIHLAGDTRERRMLEGHGWRVKEAHDVAASPADLQRYVQHSCGEFSCAKPAYVRMRTSWISDRTLCYLASGRPAIIQDTGPSRYLDGRDGVLRFSTLEEAVECLSAVGSNYAAHAGAARSLAEEHFAAPKVASRVLDQLLGKPRG